MEQKLEISHPRRILAVGYPDSGLLDLVKGLTGSSPTLASENIAGSTHNWSLETTYYKTTIPIWLDEVADPKAWAADFLGPEAREVVKALGAFVVCFRRPIDEAGLESVRTLLENVGEVVKEGCGYAWDGVCLALAMPQSTTPYLEKSFEEWDDFCQDHGGFEYVDFEARGRNEFSGEFFLPMGLERLKEALEANEWDGGELDDFEGIDDFEGLEGDDGGEFGRDYFAAESTEMEMEIFGMKRAIYEAAEKEDEGNQDKEGDDEEVEQLQAMMLKLQAVRDMGAGMPEEERKKYAAKAVNDIMKNL
ncbi:alpha and gamma adaptin binding protein p34-domain-containing protein [Xylogone sp. PMI_703]|nr:alpha and gamma adaptin binding protein p34-domain-containing protein [Xylogone sp. PMI_703]